MKVDESNFEHSFSPVSMQDIVSFETKYDFSLPDDYKQFLLINNGGKTGSRRRFTTNDNTKEGEIESSILMFFPLSNEVDANLEHHYELYTNANVIDKNYLPIGETPRNNLVCMVIKGSEKGSVYHFDMGYDDYLEKRIQLEPEHIRLIAKSFTDFFNGLFIAQS